jgi:hypothetical protein
MAPPYRLPDIQPSAIKRFGLSAIEKNEIWRRWKAGQTLHEIGRAFDKPHSSIRCLLLPRGGNSS